MIPSGQRRVLAIGEAMVEMAPAGEGIYRQGFAGDSYNTIWHMGQLLKDRFACGFVTRIGTDSLSGRFLSGMVADGLDIRAVTRDGARQMGLYLIELDGVERSFHYWRKDSAARRLADDGPALRAALEGAALVHLSGITLAILEPAARATLFSALGAARRQGTTISFDPNIRPRLWSSPGEARDAVTEMLRHADIVLPSFDDEAALWGDFSPEATARRIAALGVREVVVKDGSGPVHGLLEGAAMACPTPAVDGIRDTTGAGDAFNAGYLAARLTGDDMEASIALGQRLAAEVLRTPGALAPREQLAGLMRR